MTDSSNKFKGQIESEAAKTLFLGILALVALAVIIAVIFALQGMSSGANVPDVCDTGGGLFDKAGCLPMRASTWVYSHTIGR